MARALKNQRKVVLACAFLHFSVARGEWLSS